MAYLEQIRVVREPQNLMSRMVHAIRSYTLGPLTSRSPELEKYVNAGGPSSSGVVVTEENAMRMAAFWSAVSLISDDVASLPLNLFKKLPNGAKDKFEAHPLYRLVKESPNPEMTSFTFRRTMQSNALIWNVGYAEIERDGANRPVNLWPLLSSNMKQERRQGVLSFLYTNPGGGQVRFEQSEILQIMGPSWDGVAPMSFVGYARHSLGLGIAAEDFGAAFYKNGGTVSGVISNKSPKPVQASSDNKENADARRHSGIQQAHKWLQLWNDASFTPISTAPNNAQFIETRVFQIREVARWFKIPPHKLGDLADATFSNVEQQELAYYTSCIRPLLVSWEQELARKLIFSSEQNIQFFRHSLEGFLRADAAGRAAFYKAMAEIGVLTINEIREFEDLDPVDGGDVPFIPVNNLMPLNRVNEYIDAMIAEKTTPKPAPAAPTTMDAGPVVAEVKALLAVTEERLADYAEKLAEQSSLRAIAENVADERAESVTSLQADVERLQQQMADGQAALEVARSEQATAIRAAGDAGLEQARAADARVAELSASLLAVQVEKNDTDVMLGVAERDRDAAREDAEASAARQAEIVSQMAVLREERARSDAIIGELRTQVVDQAKKIEDYDSQLRESFQLGMEATRTSAELRMAGDVATARAVEAEKAANDATKLLAAARAAHRQLIRDTVDRLLAREAIRARKAQLTPDKLRHWIDTFYPVHAETCRAELRPVLATWASCLGVDAGPMLAREVDAHINESMQVLRALTQNEDDDARAAALERVLRRWESDRPAEVADRLIAEGEALCQNAA